MSRYYPDGNGERRRPPRRTSFDWHMPSLATSRSDAHEAPSRQRRRPARVVAYDGSGHGHTVNRPEPEPEWRRNRNRDSGNFVRYINLNARHAAASSYYEDPEPRPVEPGPSIPPAAYDEVSIEEPARFVDTVEIEDVQPRASSPREVENEDPPRVVVIDNPRGARDTRWNRKRSHSGSGSRSGSRSPIRRLEVEDMDMYDLFEFDCPRADPFKNGEASDFETPSLDNSTAALDEKPAIPGSNAIGIYSSHYNGSAELGGRHQALLTSLHNPRGVGKPLYKWLHIQQDVMNFDEFWVELSRNVYFSENERNAIGRLRADVKRQCIKSRHNSKGVKVGYMEPKFMEVPIEKPDAKGGSGQDDLQPTARWICLPYFVLQPYSGLLEGSNLSTFPTQTLLQAQYSRSTQQRDMNQAVCALGTAGKGECYHIAQVWYLALDDNLLVTCSTMSQKKLQADMIKVTSEPSPTLLGGASLRRIVVRYSDAVKWVFSPEECPTWFDFIAHFVAFWPQAIEFKRNNIEVTAKDWPKLLAYLNNSRHASVTLTLTKVLHPELPTRNLRNLDTEKDKTTAEAKNNSSPTMLPRSPALLELIKLKTDQASKPELDSLNNGLQKQLASAENFLIEQTPYLTQTAYGQCSETTRYKLETLLAAESERIDGQKDDERRRWHDQDLATFTGADKLFQLFFSEEFEGPTVSKFWGAMMELCTAPYDGYIFRSRTSKLSAQLEMLWSEISALEPFMSYMNDEARKKIEVPRSFVTAWLHTMSGLVLCARGHAEWLPHFQRLRPLLQMGIAKVVQSFPTEKLLDSCTVLPLEVASLTALKLLQDQAGDADDLGETYSQYLNSLHRIDLVRQEMTAIRRAVGQQRHIIASLRQKFYPSALYELFQPVDDETGGRRPNYPSRTKYADPEYVRRKPAARMGYLDDHFLDELDRESKLSPTERNGFRGLFLNECAGLLEQKAYEFRRYAEYADDLERAVAYKMDWTKDRQENAVYAFTVVTIVFLPLSAIAGIFGMNTSEIRDMPYTQWLYWAIALPVTISTFAIGLWWMGELGNVYRWLTGRQANFGAPKAGYATFVVPEDDSYYDEANGGGGGGGRLSRWPTSQQVQEFVLPDENWRERYHLNSVPNLSRRRSTRRPTVVRY